MIACVVAYFYVPTPRGKVCAAHPVRADYMKEQV
jgi:hypothetical protein